MQNNVPRVLITAPKSSEGKTTVTCGLLKALQNIGKNPAAFKCGPDYIDPMFHTKVIGTPSRNLDLFFTNENSINAQIALSDFAGIAVLEGVMGYYDGIDMQTGYASAFEVAKATKTPVVLVVDAKGSALSLLATIKGFVEFRENSNIKAVILNKCSKDMQQYLQGEIEKQCKVKVLGCLPMNEEYQLKSRHLGLITANEVEDLQSIISKLAEAVKNNIDLESLMEIANTAPSVPCNKVEIEHVASPVIAIAYDDAFCFYYQQNIEILQQMGAKIIYFSPINDERLPDCDGLYIGGGYPELHTGKLSKNITMLQSIKDAINRGLPTIAECGGFMYLHDTIENLQGEKHKMVGVIGGNCENIGKLARFGYIDLCANFDNAYLNKGEKIKAHEFHYFNSQNYGNCCTAIKPSGRVWQCQHFTNMLFCGFAHVYFESNLSFAERFVKAAGNV